MQFGHPLAHRCDQLHRPQQQQDRPRREMRADSDARQGVLRVVETRQVVVPLIQRAVEDGTEIECDDVEAKDRRADPDGGDEGHRGPTQCGPPSPSLMTELCGRPSIDVGARMTSMFPWLS